MRVFLLCIYISYSFTCCQCAPPKASVCFDLVTPRFSRQMVVTSTTITNVYFPTSVHPESVWSYEWSAADTHSTMCTLSVFSTGAWVLRLSIYIDEICRCKFCECNQRRFPRLVLFISCAIDKVSCWAARFMESPDSSPVSASTAATRACSRIYCHSKPCRKFSSPVGFRHLLLALSGFENELIADRNSRACS
jgi:hypothetical protein